jgi:GAF domain-containing protein
MTPRESNADLLAEITALRDRVASLTREKMQADARATEALEQKTATAGILRVISSSPTDVQPVFDAIASRVVRLCDGFFSTVWRYDGTLIHHAADNYPTEEMRAILTKGYPAPAQPGSIVAQAISEGRIIHVEDLLDDSTLPASRGVAIALGYRTLLCVPMLRDGVSIGAIAVARQEARPFSDRQIELVQTFADQAVIAIENVRLFNETKEALEQQTATSEILRVISSSPTDLQPVLDAVAENATRVCSASDAVIRLLDRGALQIAAHYGPIPVGQRLSVTRGSLAGRAVMDRQAIHVEDMSEASEDEFPEGRTSARRLGIGTALATPLLREGISIGAIVIRRNEVRPFSHTQVALLQTFADQAVIAIENVRLFTELEARNRDLSEALEQQTATAEILRIISTSPTELQPVLEVVVKSAARFCGADDAIILRLDGENLWAAAHHGPIPVDFGVPVPCVRGTVGGRSVLERRDVHVTDLQAEAEAFPEGSALAKRLGARTTLGVPLLREEAAVGTIQLRRAEVNPFTDKQIELLKTFADQAVIAIENVRLFRELQASNRELTTALDTQTATSDILRVISQSQTNVQPVFDAIVISAVRLLKAHSGSLTRLLGDQIELAALTSTDNAGDADLRGTFPRSLHSAGSIAHAIRDRAPVNETDMEVDPRRPEALRAMARARGYRSMAAVPLLLHDEAIGAISLTRREVGGFTDDEIALLQTFADQAVIAIENARLLSELQARTQELSRSVGELRALGEVGQAISSTLDLRTVLSTIVARATQLSGTDAGVIYEYDEQREVFVPRATEQLEAAIVETMLATPVRKGEGATGRLAETQEPIQVPDILAAPAESRVRDALVRAGYRALLAVPLVRDDHLLGGLTVIRKATGTFSLEVIELLRTFATQSALAIQNARLFREIEEKSHQLQVASQHKSEFLANMSHELRTPLNAIIGFSEVLAEKMFGELNEKQEEYSKDIHASGQHLLSLINDILDLSKIEAGRMELELSDFHLPTALDSALTLVRERAGRRSIALHLSVDERLGHIQADERKVRQVVLNLLSNAIKFTPEGGRIDVTAMPTDGFVEVSVSDTGVGIAPEDQEKVFEEFRQVGTADKKAEGTGLGLTLCRKFVELHGGRIWVQSQVGTGSTFTFTIPARRGE